MKKRHNISHNVSTKTSLKKRVLSMFITLSMLLFSVPAMGAVENAEIAEHWASSYMDSLTNQGIIANKENTEDNADSAITRAELTQMAVNAFSYQKQGNTVFSDVPADAWYADAIAKANGQGFLQGYNGKAEPMSPVTREDTAVMFANMLKSDMVSSVNCSDAADISDYAIGSVGALWGKGYFVGDEKGNFNPKAHLTKGEAAKLLSTVSGNIYGESREYNLYNMPISGNATITTGGVTLKNTVIAGDLYITEGVGEGEVTLENVEIKGETIVSGGGMNSIVFINTKTGMLKIEVPDGTPVRIVASGDSSIAMVAAKSESKLQDKDLTGDGFSEIVISIPANAKVSLDGKFDTVTMDTPNAALDLLGGTIGKVSVSANAENADIKIASTASVTDLNCDASAKIGGTGSIGTATINTGGVTIAQKPDNIEVSNGTSTTINNETIVGNSSDTAAKNESESESKRNDSNKNKAKQLLYDYMEIEYNPASTSLKVVFNEPIEALSNGTAASSSTLNNAFAYNDGSTIKNIPNATIQDNILELYIPTIIGQGDHSIVWQDSIKGKGFAIKGKTSGKELQEEKGALLQFSTARPNDSNFTITGPVGATVNAGEQVNFDVQITGGSGTFYYQWYRNGNLIPGANSKSYSFAAGINDNGTKFHVVVSVIPTGSTVRVSKTSASAFLDVLTVNAETVLLENGSLGTAGDQKITGLTKGYRYYVKTNNEEGIPTNYPVLADGTLGESSTEIIYKNLFDLNTTSITGLINEQWYCVYRVSANTIRLSSMNIRGGTEEMKFMGYVSPSISLQVNPGVSSIYLDLQSEAENAIVEVSRTYNKNAQWETISPSAPLTSDPYSLYFDGSTPAAFFQITIAPKNEPDVKQVYSIDVTQTSGMVINPSYHYIYPPNIYDISYNTLYQPPTQKLTEVKYGEVVLEEGTIDDRKDYVLGVDSIGNTNITITKEFLNKNVDLTKSAYHTLNFTFTDDKDNTTTKTAQFYVSVASVTPLPDKAISFGTPEFLEGDKQNYISIYVPLFLGEEAVDYGAVSSYLSSKGLTFYTSTNESSLHYYYLDIGDMANKRVENAAWNDKKGLYIYVTGLSNVDTNIIKFLAESDDASCKPIIGFRQPDGSILTSDFEKLALPLADPTAGTIEFTDATLDPAFVNSTKDYTLTKVGDSLNYEFKPSTDTKEYTIYNTAYSKTTITENGIDKTMYTTSPDLPEITYYVAQPNTAPHVYKFDFERDSEIAGKFITSHTAYSETYDYNRLATYIYTNSSYGNGNVYSEEDLKKYHLDLDATKYKFADNEVSLQQLISENYYQSGNLFFGNVKNLFAAFDFNPVSDTFTNKINVTPKLSGDYSKYTLTPSNFSLRTSYGSLNKLFIKDKNGENAQGIDLASTPNGEGFIDVEIPYPDVTIMTSSTGNYECVVYDENGLPIDSQNGVILTEDQPQPIAIVIAKGDTEPKIYKFNLIYKPATTKARAIAPTQATVSFEHYFDDELDNIVTAPPETPLEPIVPAVPVIPEKPIVPVIPDVPATPEEPIVPDVPAIPEEPIVPDVPAIPEEPLTPQEPTAPTDTPVSQNTKE